MISKIIKDLESPDLRSSPEKMHRLSVNVRKALKDDQKLQELEDLKLSLHPDHLFELEAIMEMVNASVETKSGDRVNLYTINVSFDPSKIKDISINNNLSKVIRTLNKYKIDLSSVKNLRLGNAFLSTDIFHLSYRPVAELLQDLVNGQESQFLHDFNSDESIFLAIPLLVEEQGMDFSDSLAQAPEEMWSELSSLIFNDEYFSIINICPFYDSSLFLKEVALTSQIDGALESERITFIKSDKILVIEDGEEIHCKFFRKEEVIFDMMMFVETQSQRIFLIAEIASYLEEECGFKSVSHEDGVIEFTDIRHMH